MIAKNSFLLAFFSVVSLLLGILRDRLLAEYVGVGPVLDVYKAAFRIPDLVYGILFSFVSAVTVVPFITKAVHDNDKKELEVRFNSLFFFFSVVIFVIALVIIITLPLFAKYLVSGFSQEQLSLFIFSSRVLMIQPFLLGLSALISCLGQVRHRFLLYSTAPLLYTVGIILSIIFLYRPFGLIGIIGGVLGGALLGLLVQSYSLYKEDIEWSWSLFSWQAIKEHLHNAIPRSGSTITSRTRELIFASIATSFGVGALSVYVFAVRVTDAFIQVVVQSASTATLPILSRHHAIGEKKEYTRVLVTNLAVIFALSLVAALVCIFFPHLIVRVLYGSQEGTAAIIPLVVLLAYNLPLYSINAYFVSAFSAARDGKGLFFANLIATTLSIIALLVAREKGYGITSLAIATWTLGISYTLLLLYFYSRKRHTTNAS